MTTNASILQDRIRAASKPRVTKVATAEAVAYLVHLLKSKNFNITRQTVLSGGAEFSIYFQGKALGGVLTFINDKDTGLVGASFSPEPGKTMLAMMHSSNGAIAVAKESKNLYGAFYKQANLMMPPEAVDKLASDIEKMAENAEAMLAWMRGDLEFINALADELGALVSILDKIDKEINRD